MKVLVGLLILLLISLQYRLWFGDGSLQEVWRLGEEARATNAKLLQLQSRNQALEAEVADLKSGLEAIEERARTELGMVDSDETFYQFVRERASEARRDGAAMRDDAANRDGAANRDDAANRDNSAASR
jgi:cell division protein FtsB